MLKNFASVHPHIGSHLRGMRQADSVTVVEECNAQVPGNIEMLHNTT